MNPFDAIRMISYTIITPSLIIIAASIYRSGMRRPAAMCLFLAMFFAWLLFEATLTSTGTNTRELRAWATPITVLIAISAVATILQLNKRSS